jgi:predicted Zn-dependent peptidase
MFATNTQSGIIQHPLTLPNIGSKELIPKLHVSQVERCWKRITNPKNMIVTVVGNFRLDAMKHKIEQIFSQLRPRYSMPLKQFYNNQAERRIAILEKDLEQIYFHLGFPTFGWNDEKYYAMALLNNILGGKSSSRLYQQLRGNKGIVYFIGSVIWHYQDIGYLHIQTSCSPKNTPELIGNIIDELKRMKNEKVSVDELKEAQANLKGHAVTEFEKVLFAAKFYSGQALRLHKIVPVNTYKQRIGMVGRRDLQSLAQQFFLTEKINLAMVGPVDSGLKSQIEQILVL